MDRPIRPPQVPPGDDRSRGGGDHPVCCRACGIVLRGEVLQGLCERCVARALLEGPEAAEELGPAIGPAAGSPPGWDGGVPRHLGGYELLEELGHGGMGLVYRARHLRLGRIVALKLLLLGRYAGAGSVQRFFREAAAAARLRHPNIVAVHEIGEEAGYHFISMEYVEGRSLAELLRAGPLPAARAAACCRTLAAAVHYAHGEGILHRDLKPSNVLLDAVDQPRVADFGLAKQLDSPGDLTVSGELMGSPSYLSPEQAAGRQHDLGPPSDVYALGAILYECLTGRPPFAAASVPEVLLQVRDAEPVPPRALNRGVPADLETIALKCLEKKPTHRYPTAGMLGDDLGRFLRGEPTLARPVGAVGKARRWARRKPMHALALALIVLTALVTSVAGYRADQARLETRRVNEQLQANLRRLQWQAAEDAIAEGRVGDALAVFARQLRDQPHDPILATRLASLLSRRAFALPSGPPLAHEAPLASVAFSRGGDLLLTASLDGSARLWRTEDGSLVRRWVDRGPLAEAALSADGRRVLTLRAVGGGRLWRREDGSIVREWGSGAGRSALFAMGPTDPLAAIVEAPNQVRILELETGTDVGPVLEHGSAVRALTFGPQGRQLWVGTEAGELHQWRLAGADELHRVQARLGSPVSAVALTPDGRRVLAGTRRGGFFIFDTSDLTRPLVASTDSAANLELIRCAPAGSLAVIARFGEWPEMWDLSTLRQVGLFQRTDNDIVRAAEWSPDGEAVLLGFRSGMSALHSARTLQPVQEPFEHQGPIVGVGFHPDGTRVVTASQDATARIWDVRARQARQPGALLPGRAGAELVQQGGTLRLAATRGPEAWVCDGRTGKPVGPPFHHDADVRVAVLSPDGTRLATGARGLSIWEVAAGAGTRLGPWGDEEPVDAIAWDPAGRWVLSATAGGRVERRAVDGRPLMEAVSLHSPVWRLAVSPDGQTCAAVCADASVRVFDASTGRAHIDPLRHRGRIWTAEFSPDSRRLVTASIDRTVRVWDLATGWRLTPSMRHERAVLVARFSPDGRVIASGGEDRMVRLWDSATGRPLSPPLRHGSRVWIVAFSPDGERLLTAADAGDVRVWDVRTGLPLTEPMAHGGTMLRTWFASGGTEIVAATHGAEVTVWPVDPPCRTAPAWFPDLAEALAGRRLERDGSLGPASEKIFDRLRGELALLAEQDPVRGWAQRFLPRDAGAGDGLE